MMWTEKVNSWRRGKWKTQSVTGIKKKQTKTTKKGLWVVEESFKEAKELLGKENHSVLLSN